MSKLALVFVALSVAFVSVISGLSAGVEAAYLSPEMAAEPGLSGGGVKQLIQEFVDTSGGDVTADGGAAKTGDILIRCMGDEGDGLILFDGQTARAAALEDGLQR